MVGDWTKTTALSDAGNPANEHEDEGEGEEGREIGKGVLTGKAAVDTEGIGIDWVVGGWFSS